MSERRFGRLSGFKAGVTVFIAAPLVAGLALSGCATSPVEFGSGSPEELELAKEISLHEFEVNLAPEESEGRNDVEVKLVEIDELSMAHTRIQQTFRGVRVFGGEAIVHLNRDGSYRDATDALVRGIPRSFNTTPKLSVRDARDRVIATQECAGCLTAEPEVDMFILPQEREMKLAYRVSLRREDGTDKTSMPVIFIDAHTGEKLLEYDNLQTVEGSGTTLYSGVQKFETTKVGSTYYLEDMTRLVGTLSYKNGQGTSPSGRYTDTDTSWAKEAALDAHWGAMKVYDYYLNVHGRKGIDEVGGPGLATASSNSSIKLITSGVHYGVKYNNAYWDGKQMTYGDGDGSTFTALTSLDVCGHEMTHGVIERTAGLVYSKEPGALNEAIADIFGALIEQSVKGKTNMYLIGEDIYTPGTPGDALRYMNDPAKGGQPDHYSKRSLNSADNYGVHTNSGIVNKMFYMLSEGGTHTNVTVTGIGSTDAGKIVYRALTKYMTSTTNFAAARTAMLNAANDLFGSSSAQSTAVSKAWESVGVGAAAAPAACVHDKCAQGAALTSGCSSDACVVTVCTKDSWCCSNKWDAQCVSETNQFCGAGTCK